MSPVANDRVRLGVTTILFGWTGYHYFYWRSWIRGTVLALFSLLLLIAGGWGLMLTIAFGVYDGIRYLCMTDEAFGELVRRKSNRRSDAG